MPKTCDCEGFEDRWDNDRETHYTVTLHDDECPENPINRAMAKADHDYDVAKDEGRNQWADDDLAGA